MTSAQGSLGASSPSPPQRDRIPPARSYSAPRLPPGPAQPCLRAPRGALASLLRGEPTGGRSYQCSPAAPHLLGAWLCTLLLRGSACPPHWPEGKNPGKPWQQAASGSPAWHLLQPTPEGQRQGDNPGPPRPWGQEGRWPGCSQAALRVRGFPGLGPSSAKPTTPRPADPPTRVRSNGPAHREDGSLLISA